jgi:hypothetical protein
MGTPTLTGNSFDEYRLIAPPATDRLPAMLFLAALLHGVLILGVTFNPSLTDQFTEAISLEVTIVADPDDLIERPDRAEYLAQTSQLGGGNTTERSAPVGTHGKRLADRQSRGPRMATSLLDYGPIHEQAADAVRGYDATTATTLTGCPAQRPAGRTPAPRMALERGTDNDAATAAGRPGHTSMIHDDEPRAAHRQCRHARSVDRRLSR